MYFHIISMLKLALQSHLPTYTQSLSPTHIKNSLRCPDFFLQQPRGSYKGLKQNNMPMPKACYYLQAASTQLWTNWSTSLFVLISRVTWLNKWGSAGGIFISSLFRKLFTFYSFTQFSSLFQILLQAFPNFFFNLCKF